MPPSLHIHRRPRVSLILFSIILLVFFFGRRPFERALQLIQRPFVVAGTWIYREHVPDETQRLQEAVAALAVDQVRLQEIEKENAALKEALAFSERTQETLLTARVSARSQTSQGTRFTVDVGARDGVQIGDPVIVKDGVLVGKVSQVSLASASIELLSDPETATAVSILGQSQTIGVAEGLSGNLLRLKFIPKEVPLETNHLVVTSGLEANIPSGLFVGLVNDVRPEENSPFQQAIIEPIVDPKQFSLVHVLISQPL